MNTQNDTKKANVCTACSCPCELHKEHNHPVEKKREGAKTCSVCGQENKQDGKPACECK